MVSCIFKTLFRLFNLIAPASSCALLVLSAVADISLTIHEIVHTHTHTLRSATSFSRTEWQLKAKTTVEYSYCNIPAQIIAYNSNTTRIELTLFTRFARSHESMNNYAKYAIFTKCFTKLLVFREREQCLSHTIVRRLFLNSGELTKLRRRRQRERH